MRASMGSVRGLGSAGIGVCVGLKVVRLAWCVWVLAYTLCDAHGHTNAARPSALVYAAGRAGVHAQRIFSIVGAGPRALGCGVPCCSRAPRGFAASYTWSRLANGVLGRMWHRS